MPVDRKYSCPVTYGQRHTGWKWLPILLLWPCLLIACGGEKPKTHFVIGFPAQPAFALLFIAESQGYFDAEGVDAEFRFYSSGKDAVQAMLRNEINLAGSHETPVVRAGFASSPIQVLCTLQTSSENVSLIARRDRAISNANDLRGKKIALTQGTNSEYFLYTLLTWVGLERSQVQLVDAAPERIVELLASGTVDAIVAWNPQAFQAREILTSDKVISLLSPVYLDIAVLSSRKDLSEQQDLALYGLVRALDRAESFARENEAAAAEIIDHRLPQMKVTADSPLWRSFHFEVKLDNLLLAVLKMEAQWIGRTELPNAQLPDMRELLVTKYLLAADPEAVTIEWPRQTKKPIPEPE